jgi:hypothetical protein
MTGRLLCDCLYVISGRFPDTNGNYPKSFRKNSKSKSVSPECGSGKTGKIFWKVLYALCQFNSSWFFQLKKLHEEIFGNPGNHVAHYVLPCVIFRKISGNKEVDSWKRPERRAWTVVTIVSPLAWSKRDVMV